MPLRRSPTRIAAADPEGAPSPELLRTLAYITQFAPTFSLRGGTREVLRGMIARGLGLAMKPTSSRRAARAPARRRVPAGDACARSSAAARRRALWTRARGSGFLDALVPRVRRRRGAAAGGGALRSSSPRAATSLPVPMAHTMLARARARDARRALRRRGSIAIASRTAACERQRRVSAARRAAGSTDWVAGRRTRTAGCLLRAAEAERTPSGVHGSLRADLAGRRCRPHVRRAPQPVDWQAAGAAVTAAQIAGATGARAADDRRAMPTSACSSGGRSASSRRSSTSSR